MTHQPVRRLVMVTPFDRSIVGLSTEEQLVLLKGCVLCQITRDVSTDGRSKPEWKSCRAEMGVRIDVHTIDVAGQPVLAAMNHRAPAVVAETADGAFMLLLDDEALARCKGSVTDFRGRLLFRLAALGLVLPDSKPDAANGR